LSIDGQKVGIIQDNRFEKHATTELDIRFGEKFQIFAYEFDDFAVGTIDGHYIVFDFLFVDTIDFRQKRIDNRLFARSRRPVKNNMWDLFGFIELVECICNGL
jgi:hypothetical protein